MNWELSICTAAAAATTAAPVEPAMDEAAFAAFHARTARPLWAYLARAASNRTLADDLVQESYLRFLRSAEWSQGEVACRRYLFTIATNLLRDHWRKAKTTPLDDVPEAALADAGGMNPGALAAQWDREAALAPAMAQLRPRERQMLWLAYVEGYTHREIAAVMGLQTASLRLLLFRARRKLAHLLTREGAA